LWFGVERSASRERNRQLLRRALSAWTIWPFDEPAAAEYGRIAALLRGLGRPIQQIDIQIAAVALSLGKTTVVSEDGDLGAIPGLDVESWATA
jgi:tRNA(fMet)-specific endonuclease VapC